MVLLQHLVIKKQNHTAVIMMISLLNGKIRQQDLNPTVSLAAFYWGSPGVDFSYDFRSATFIEIALSRSRNRPPGSNPDKEEKY